MPMNLAAWLCEREFAAIRVQLETGLGDKALQSLDERGSAQELIRQQYSGRYPFELLQNANDAAAEASRSGRACFTLTDMALIVADNGTGFGEPQIKGICSLGRSPKGPGTSIGHKGLGFKSVGEITDQPQIISGQALFQFDRDRVHRETLALFGSLPAEQRFPVYAFPFSVLDEDLGTDAAIVHQLLADDFSTVIRLPLREGIARETVARHLADNLLPRLLLFLPSIDRLELHGTDADFSAVIVRSIEGATEHVLLETGAQTEEWLLYRGSATPEPPALEPMGEAWTKIDKVNYAVAIPLDDWGQPRTDETFPLHVYFPTEEEPGLHVAIHAEWVLGMDRRQLSVANEAVAYNSLLLAEVANFAATDVAVDLVTRCGASAAAVRALLPAPRAEAFGNGAALRERLSEALTDACFLPFADGALRTPADARMLPATLPGIAEAHALANLDGECTLRADIEALEAVQKFLKSRPMPRVMTSQELIRNLRPPASATAGAYYSFLVRWRSLAGFGGTKVIDDELKQRPSVLARNGEALAPGQGPVFLPPRRGDSAIAVDIPVPIAMIPVTKDAKDFDRVADLLRDLGVKPFEWRDLIREFLVKILDDPHAELDLRARALAGLRAYYRDRRSGSDDLTQVLGRVLLPARTADGTRRELRAGAQLYFGAEWTGSGDLEVIYGPFGGTDFLDAEVPADPDQKQTDREFYKMLGVEDHPRLDVARTERASDFPLGSLRHPHRGALFDEWMAQPDVEEKSHCPHGHDQQQQLKLSIRLDRHLELIESQDPARLLALWRQLARHWGGAYAPAMEAVFRCQHGWHQGERDRKCESLFAYALRSRPWVPVVRGRAVELVRPEYAWIDSTLTPGRIRDRIPRINETMRKAPGAAGLIAALHLADIAWPTVRNLLALLADIADEADEAGTVSREVALAARWVHRTLDDVLPEKQQPHPDPGHVRLLASHDGVLAFVPQPLFVDDPLLRETWEKRSPVLAAETGLSRLMKFLALTKLDNEVQISAVPDGVHQDDHVFIEARRKIDGIKPYLFALVRAESSRNETRVRSGLGNIELIVCDELSLHYEYDSTEVTREDAVCFIASRQAGRGRHSRTLDTAYLEVDPSTGNPHWFAFGRQLARHFGVPTLADVFTMLFAIPPGDWDRVMADRQISRQDIAEAREQLQLPPDSDEEIADVLDSLLPGGQPETQQPGLVAGTGESTAETPPSAGDQDHRDSEPSSPDPMPAVTPEPSPPPVDYNKVRIIDAKPDTLTPQEQERSAPSGAGGFSTAPPQPERNLRIGKRGEEIVYNKERHRLQALRMNPDSVTWVSKTNETSPYDIRSLDEDGQVIYIEVKSTKGTDPNGQFWISRAEVELARSKRGRYYIYRVTDTDTEAPTIRRVSDPLGLILEGKGRVMLSQARVELSFGSSEDTPDDSPKSDQA